MSIAVNVGALLFKPKTKGFDRGLPQRERESVLAATFFENAAPAKDAGDQLNGRASPAFAFFSLSLRPLINLAEQRVLALLQTPKEGQRSSRCAFFRAVDEVDEGVTAFLRPGPPARSPR